MEPSQIYYALREIKRDPAFIAQAVERRSNHISGGSASQIKALESRINALLS